MQGSWLFVFTTLLTIVHSDLLEGTGGKVIEVPDKIYHENCPEQPRCTNDAAHSSLPYIQDCKMYIYCMENGNVELLTCPDYQEFSSTEGYCMDAALASCAECSVSQITIPMCSEQPECTPEDAYNNIPYLADCTKYIYCAPDGKEIIIYCANGTEFSPTNGTCMEPVLAGCPKCSEFVSTTTTTSTTIVYCPEQPECTPEDAYNNLPYLADCTKYIHCAPDGTELIVSCGNETEFSPTNGTCMDPELAGCPECSEFISTTTSTTVVFCPEQPECTPEDESFNIPYVADCTKYTHCAPTGPIILDCIPGHEFSPTERICMNSTQANCTTCIATTDITTTTQAMSFTTQIMTTPHCPEQLNCTPEYDYTYIPYVADCSKFIFCEPTGSNPMLDCPSGQHFSPTTGGCLPAEEAGCPQCIQTTIISSSTTFNPQCIQQQCTAELIYSLLPLVSDCTKYIYCVDDQGTEEIRTCPNGEYFSPSEHKCTDPASAGCPVC